MNILFAVFECFKDVFDWLKLANCCKINKKQCNIWRQDARSPAS